MKKRAISIESSQLFALVVLFELGSSVVIGLGIERAEQDAWLAILLALLGGMALYWIYAALYRGCPDRPLTGYARSILGTVPGWILGLLYVVYFIYIASRVMRDFSDLLSIIWLDRTPVVVVTAAMLLSIAYVLSLGTAAFARTGQLTFALMMLSLFVIVLLIMIGGLIRPTSLQPILEKGWKPVANVAYPQILTFPFGEIVVFTMILPLLKKPAEGVRAGFRALVTSGLLLAGVIGLDILVLGPDLASRSTFPLLTAISLVEIMDFLERLESLAVLILIIGGFFKIALFIFAAVRGAADLFRVQEKELVLPVCMIVLYISMIIAQNYPEHLREGLIIVPSFVHLPMQVLFPLLLLIIHGLRIRIRRRQED